MNENIASANFLQKVKAACVIKKMRVPFRGFHGQIKDETQDEGRIDILGIVANRDGKTVSGFQNDPSEPQNSSDHLAYNRLMPIDPGLYQVRLAAHATKIGRLGSAHL